ncbi:MAG: sigma-70 family polymerase sigma factor [Herbinix sp.]|jgi:RNA polymerase sigma-70 factor (ECF subfamily)|nr:sigma-70 family polymerase sigma factor [Herbinix sp.]
MDILEIYNNHYKSIYNYALRLSCHPEDACDITQETFLIALEKMTSLKNDEAITGWLRTICYHRFIDQIRRNKYLVEVDDWEQLEKEGGFLQSYVSQPEDEVIVSEEIRDLQNGCFLAMVRKLTLNQRIAFSLVDMYGMKIEAVSDILQISVSAAKGLLYRARMNIDSFFANHCELMNEKNPCSCKAWIEFSSQRNNLQKRTKKLIEKLDFKKDGYVFNESIRAKIEYLYINMPDKKPSDEWYNNVLNILRKNSK